MKFIIISFFSWLLFMLMMHMSVGLAMRDYAPAQPLSILDTGSNKTSMFKVSDARQAIFGTPALAKNNQPKLIFMGASTVRAGFRPEDWHNIMPNLETHNAAVGSANIAALNHLWPHIQQAIAPAIAHQSTVVIGLVYPMFSENLTDYIARENARLKLFYFLGMGNWGTPSIWNFIKLQTYRYFGLDTYLQMQSAKLMSALTKMMRKKKIQKFLALQTNQVAPVPPKIDPHDHAANMVRWAKIMENTSISNQHYTQVENLIKNIRQAGFKVVVVSMPLPIWHSQLSPFDQPFCQQLRTHMSNLMLTDKNIYFVDLHQKFQDTDFRDSSHANREGAKRFSLQLYKELNQLSFLS